MGRVWPWAIGAFIIWSVVKGEPKNNQTQAELSTQKTADEDQRLPFTVTKIPSTKPVLTAKKIAQTQQRLCRRSRQRLNHTSAPTNLLVEIKPIGARTMYVDASSLHVRAQPG